MVLRRRGTYSGSSSSSSARTCGWSIDTIMTGETPVNVLVPPSRRSLAENVADRIREAIYNGQLAPNERLREETLADFLRVSRGPIREALSQLEREGLVIKEPNRGATVARLSREDLREVYSLRLALEQLALQEAIQHAETRHLDEMQQVIDETHAAMVNGTSVQEAARLDVAFHEIIYRASGHKRLHNH